jgi:hypothetical protein
LNALEAELLRRDPKWNTAPQALIPMMRDVRHSFTQASKDLVNWGMLFSSVIGLKIGKQGRKTQITLVWESLGKTCFQTVEGSS